MQSNQLLLAEEALGESSTVGLIVDTWHSG